MKLHKVVLVNAKILEAFQHDFGGHSAIISAKNERGKSTLIDFLQQTIFESGDIGNPITFGKDGTEASFELVAPDGSKLFAKYRAWKKADGSIAEDISIQSEDGGKWSTKTAREQLFRGRKLFDLTDFIQNTKTKEGRRKNIKEYFAPLAGFDYDDYRKRIQEMEAKRASAGDTIRQIEGAFKMQGLNVADKIDATPVDITSVKQKLGDLRNKQSAFEAKQREYEALEETGSRIATQIDAIRAQLKELEAKADANNSEMLVCAADLAGFVVPSADDINAAEAEYKKALETNTRAQNAANMVAKQAEWQAAKDTYETIQDGIKGVREKATQTMATLSLPDELSIEADGDELSLMYDNGSGKVPFDDTTVAASKLAMSSLRIGMMLLKNSTIRFICAKDAILMDKENRDKIVAEAEANGFQIFLEMVSDQDNLEVFTIE